MLLLGDCKEVLKQYPDNHFDLIVTDPPYGISFMGKDWDKALPDKEVWKECFRVLKEGKLAFIMCSPRQDVLSRMIIALEEAGFRTNYTSIYWTYASGFPKAANISKLIDKRNGRDEVIRKQFAQYLEKKRIEAKITHAKIHHHLGKKNHGGGLVAHWKPDAIEPGVPTLEDWNKLKEIIDLGTKWDWFVERKEAEREIIGKGQCGDPAAWYAGNQSKKLEYNITKPATEEAKKMEGAYVGFQPKPAVEVILCVSKGKTLTWLDNCRIPYGEGNDKGRFPANLTVEDNVLADYSKYFDLDAWAKTFPFLICPKASKAERNKGCEDLPFRELGHTNNMKCANCGLLILSGTSPSCKCPIGVKKEIKQTAQNSHPTVKPLKLLSYLITLGSRENDLILDPFVGSGTSYLACMNLNRNCVGIEINPDYLEIAKARVKPLLEQTKII